MMAGNDWVTAVLAFWFEELDRDAWFKKSAETDRAICDRFLTIYDEIVTTDEGVLVGDARTALAAIIVLDQFPRNMFRNQPKAFATDGRALRLAKAAVAARLDEGMSVNERLFMYLPFEHSEVMAGQEQSVALIGALGDGELTRYAVAHRDVIATYGRFPHRNAILGRTSTVEEEDYLAKPGSGF
jgi:uncharacterized protein (DUF924 family)